MNQMESLRSNESEEIGLKFYSLRMRERSISPCSISYVYGAHNSVHWNKIPLKMKNKYWFELQGDLKIGDRMEILISDPKTKDLLKMTTLELIELRKKSIRFLELARTDFKAPAKELEVCPTCHREL